jgi:hypothetical protein
MINFGPYTKSLIGAMLIGAGIGLMAMAMRELKEGECVGCEEDDAEAAIEAVAEASAEMAAEPEETDAA